MVDYVININNINNINININIYIYIVLYAKRYIFISCFGK